MARVTKDPEERKREIIEAAVDLFTDKGFENTSVSDIVKKIMVAQGTFYYYFKSKDDVLNEVVEIYSNKVYEKFKVIAYNDSLAPQEKIEKIIAERLEFFKGNKKIIRFVIKHMRNTGTKEVQKLLGSIKSKIKPLFIHIFTEGNEKGIFKIEHIEDTVELLIMGIGYFVGRFADNMGNIEKYREIASTANYFYRRLLQTNESFDLDILKGLEVIMGE